MQLDYSKLEAERERLLKAASRIVVKLGTSTVTAPDGTLCLKGFPLGRRMSCNCCTRGPT